MVNMMMEWWFLINSPFWLVGRKLVEGFGDVLMKWGWYDDGMMI